jgi:hypothetical protein
MESVKSCIQVQIHASLEVRTALVRVLMNRHYHLLVWSLKHVRPSLRYRDSDPAFFTIHQVVEI